MQQINRAAALVCLFSALLCGQAYQDSQTIRASGGTITVANPRGSKQASFEENWFGFATTGTVTVQGCTAGNSCSQIDTVTTAGNQTSVRQVTTTPVYDHFVITATWSGGTGVTVTVNSTLQGPQTVVPSPMFGPLTGDCTSSGSAVTCTKTNGAAFAASATTDTTNAANIASGNVAAARMPTTYNPITIAGSAATDSASLGAELIDNTGWTSTGWTGAYPWTHTAGNTSALSRAITGMANNTYWQVVLTIASRTAGTVDLSIGGTFVGTFSAASTTRGPKATGTGALTITPTTDFDGTVSISVKAITAIPSFALSVNDSTGAFSNRLSAQLAAKQNIFLGDGGTRNTTALNNTGIGIGALTNVTTGGNNTALGNSALQNNTQAVGNTAVGYQSLQLNTTGGSNTAVGMWALNANTTGIGNTATGWNALSTVTTASNNTADGDGVLGSATSANNTGTGFHALLNTSTGGNNTADGYSAGGIITTGHDNVFLGYLATADTNSRTNGVAIGSGAIVAQDNSGVLGTNGMKWSVGGDPIPSGTLEVRDTTASTGATTLVVQSGAGQAATNLFDVKDAAGTTHYLTVSAAGMSAPLTTPASSSAACAAGQIEWDASYLYICTATNTWKRATLATF